MKYVRQEITNGCGVASIANILGKSYKEVQSEFESSFYKIVQYTNIFDIVRFLEKYNLQYKVKFFNRRKRYSAKEFARYSEIYNSITLTKPDKIYPLGHYLVRKEEGWIDPWINFPRIISVKAGIRRRLINSPWYVAYPT